MLAERERERESLKNICFLLIFIIFIEFNQTA